MIQPQWPMSQSDCGVSLAPSDFHMEDMDDADSPSADEDGEQQVRIIRHVLPLRCALCLGDRRKFYCTDCTREGKYVHSAHVTHCCEGRFDQGSSLDSFTDEESAQECFADKMERWKRLEAERVELVERFEAAVIRLRVINKRTEARLARERIALLRDMLSASNENLEKDQEKLRTLQQKTAKTMEHLTWSMPRKRNNIRTYIDKLLADQALSSDLLWKASAELTRIRRLRIGQLTRDIFPIQEIEPTSLDVESLEMLGGVSMLAEACPTTYVRGRWVFNDGSWGPMFSIVEPTLPGNGDYSVYGSSLVSRRNSMPGSSQEPSHHNPSCTIAAGLSLTSQLVSLLAYYLDINVPLRQAYIEFSGADLSEQKFSSAVFKLNRNILYMCFVHNIELDTLHARNTLYNLLLLLNSPNLGAQCLAEGDAAAMQSLEESLLTPSVDFDLSDCDPCDPCDPSEDPTVAEFTDRDWEHVPVTLPEAEMTLPPPHRAGGGPFSVSYFSSAPAAVGGVGGGESSVTSIAGGLVSSAASSVASLWSWRSSWGGRTDK